MQGVKVNLVGQTFALAACNDARGRKPRIRRSKEERRAMVESFIKKYRTANNGNLPSLNITHKEVGGSFYTVRDIFREIIQEEIATSSSSTLPEERSFNSSSQQASGCFCGEEPQGFMSLSLPIGQEITETVFETLVHDSTHQCVTKEPVTVESIYSANSNHEVVECMTVATAEQSYTEEYEEISREFHYRCEGEDRTKHLVVESSTREMEASTHNLRDNENGGVSEDKNGTLIPQKAEISENSGNKNWPIDKSYELAGGIKTQELCETVSIPSSPIITSRGNDDEIVKQNGAKALLTNVIAEIDAIPKTVGKEDVPETKIVINTVIDNNSVSAQDKTVSPHVRFAFCLEGGSKETQSFSGVLGKKHLSVEEEGSLAPVNLGFTEIRLDSPGILSSSAVRENGMAYFANPLLESAGCHATGESSMIDLLGSGTDELIRKENEDLQADVSRNDVSNLETFSPELRPIGAHNNTSAVSIACNTSTTREEFVSPVKKEEGAQIESEFKGSSPDKRGSHYVLERKNSGSLERATKEPTKPESNPIWAVLKAFVDSFVKFWRSLGL